MKKNNCDVFFEALAVRWHGGVRVLLIGGAAAQILGKIRPTMDVDFEAVLLDSADGWEKFEQAIEETEKITGIEAQFSENVDRWSMISLLDYRKHTRHHKDFKRIKVYVLEPEYWSIGKIGRYLDIDAQDMIFVFKKHKVKPVKLAKLWQRALKESLRSKDLFILKKNAEHFFKTYGKEIWGRNFPEEEIKKLGF